MEHEPEIVETQRRSPGFGVTSMVLGIVSLLLSAAFGGLLGLLALIFGVIGVRRHSGKGFAIAGIVTGSAAIVLNLIFLVVLVSLPALQKNQADTQRRVDAGRVVTAIINYKSDHMGDLPPADDLVTFTKSYIAINGASFTDPSGEQYSFIDHTPDTLSQIQYAPESVCDPTGTKLVPSLSKRAGILMKLSSGVYCTNS